MGIGKPFGDHYIVYEDGRIWRNSYTTTRKDGVTRRWPAKWLKPRIKKGNKGNGGGYALVDLHIDGKSKTMLHHRVVALAHIPNPDNLPDVNHDNGIRHDCRVENLYWSTKSDNQKHAYENLRDDLADKHYFGVLTPDQAVEVFNRRNFGGEKLKDLATEYNVGFQRISAVAKGDHSSIKNMKHLVKDFSCGLSEEAVNQILSDSKEMKPCEAIKKNGVSRTTYYRILKLYSS